MDRILSPGEPAPWFHGHALDGNPRYAFDTTGGRHIVLLLAGSAAGEAVQAALRTLAEHRALFDDARACFFGVTADPRDAAEGRVRQDLPGIRWFLDYDRAISAKYGAIGSAAEATTYRPHWILLDPSLRVLRVAALPDGAALFAALREELDRPQPAIPAPVLVVPNVLPPELCRHLIALYEEKGGVDSGFMREENGITVTKTDYAHKRRADYHIEDEALVAHLKGRLASTLRPMIQRAFQFDATRVERFLVACYDGGEGGHFRAHRDNTTKGTAHRRFACTINLNADEFEGGNLRFPEFGAATYRAPTGGAVVFSCSLLHEAQPVTRGRRFAFLPFFYDDAAARIRERNLDFVAPELKSYRSGLPPEQGAAAAGA